MFTYGVFHDESAATQAVKNLNDAGFAGRDIGVLLAHEDAVVEVPVEVKTEGVRGALIGAALGALGGALLVPAAGLLAAGPVLAAVEAAAVGGAAGATIGTIGGLGYWENHAELVKEHVEKGAVLVGVEAPEGRRDEALAALRAAGADDVRVGERTGVPSPS